MVGLEHALCGCVYDSSPAGWLSACDQHQPRFMIYKDSKWLNHLVNRKTDYAFDRETRQQALRLLLEEQSKEGDSAREIMQRISDWEKEQLSNTVPGHGSEGSGQSVQHTSLVTMLLGIE